MCPRSNDPTTQRVLATVDSIPKGRVATYGQVAREAGLPGRARLVGRILGELAKGSGLPWHRVLRAGGILSSLPGAGALTQRAKLEAEGVEFDRAGRVHLPACAWDPEGPARGPAEVT